LLPIGTVPLWRGSGCERQPGEGESKLFAWVCLRLPPIINIDKNHYDIFLALTLLTGFAPSIFVTYNCVRNCAQPLFGRTLIYNDNNDSSASDHLPSRIEPTHSSDLI
jgi:hypothetical protein